MDKNSSPRWEEKYEKKIKEGEDAKRYLKIARQSFCKVDWINMKLDKSKIKEYTLIKKEWN